MEILGVGAALVDIIARVDASFLPRHSLVPGAVQHVPIDEAKELLASLTDAHVSSGGGAANSIKAATLLGMDAGFAGCLGNDEEARVFKAEMEASGARLFTSESCFPTGVFISLYDDTGLRSIVASPSASASLDPLAIPDEALEGLSWLYLDGFAIKDNDGFRELIRRAREKGARIAIDIASPFIARERRSFIVETLRDEGSFAFATLAEALALGGIEEGAEDALGKAEAFMSSLGCLFAIKLGAQGAVARRGSERAFAPASKLEVLDKTGSGDAFASGFLCALQSERSLEEACAFGNECAAQALIVRGSSLDPEAMKEIGRRIRG